MPVFRAYLLDTAGKIVWGDWIECADLDEAKARAHELCDKGSPTVELWQGAKRVAKLPCVES